MKTFLIFLYILFCAGSLSLFMKVKVGKTIPMVVLSNVFVLYIFGLIFRDLRVGVVANVIAPFAVWGGTAGIG